MKEPNLSNQVALVTGAGRGIGRAIALELARCGAHVVLAARTQAQIDAVADEIRRDGGTASVIAGDLSEEGPIVTLFQQIARSHGRLDILVNNAGIGFFGPIADYPASQLDVVLNTNIRGPFLCCREAVKLMLAAKCGYIINIASVVGFKGYPLQVAYTASKHAVMGLTKALAAEMNSQGIRVSAILPGGVDTGMVGDARPDLNREDLLQPEDIAQSVMYLLALSSKAAVDQIYIRRRKSAPF